MYVLTQFCYLLIFASCSLWSGDEETRIDQKVEEFSKTVNQLVVEQLVDGEVLVVQGVQSVIHVKSDDIALTQPPQFMIGSVSKQFYAAALLKALYESTLEGEVDIRVADVQKKLHLPISFYLPEQAALWSNQMPAWAHQVSIHHLLTHTSGVANYTACDEYHAVYENNMKFFEFRHDPKDMIQLIVHKELSFVPGSQYAYSNTGYLIIAEIIESITKKTVSQYLQESIFDPLELTFTSNPQEGTWQKLHLEPKTKNLVPQWRYNLLADTKVLYPLIHCEDISVAKGAGSLVSSASDIVKWNQALHKAKIVLPEQLYNLMITPYLNEYGYGISIENTNMGTMFGHAGGIGAYRTLVCYFPEHDLSVIILSHIAGDDDRIVEEYKKLLHELQKTIFDEEVCQKKAQEIMSQKYPDTRGFERMRQRLESLFEIQ